MSEAAVETGLAAGDAESLTNGYLKAFVERDLARCLAFFDDASVIEFQTGVYKGMAAIESWHKDRFAANLRLLEMQSIHADGPVVTIDALVASNRLSAWGLKSIAGRLIVKVDGERIRHAKLSPRMNNPINSIRSSLGR